jgi:hypothetical protein
MLQASDRHVVLSEPPPLDSVLRAHIRDSSLSEERRVEWLVWMLSALGIKRRPEQERLFVKFDCWNIAELPVVHHAFPDTPWIFLYRDPLEVLVSQLRAPALWSMPGGLPPAVLGLDPAEISELPRDEHCARMIGRICEIALDRVRDTSGGLLVNYAELPDCFYSHIAGHFQLDLSSAEIEQARETAGMNAKSPWFAFEADSDKKQNEATARMRDLTNTWARPFYDDLEALRRQ